MWVWVCMWSSSRLARSWNRGVAVDSQWHHRALKLNYWPLGSSLGRTTPKQLAAVGFCSPHCHFKALLSPECNHLVFTFTSCEIMCFWTAESKLSSSGNWQHWLLVQTLKVICLLCPDNQNQRHEACCWNTTKPLWQEVGIDGWRATCLTLTPETEVCILSPTNRQHWFLFTMTTILLELPKLKP